MIRLLFVSRTGAKRRKSERRLCQVQSFLDERKDIPVKSAL